MQRRVFQAAIGSAVGAVTVGLASAYRHRPLPDVADMHWGGPSHHGKGKPVREDDHPGLSSESPSRVSAVSDATAQDPLSLTLGRFVVVGAIASVVGAGMSGYYNRFRAKDDANYQNFLSLLKLTRDDGDGRSQQGKRTLLTVSNHCSTLDDPILFGSILPGFSSWVPSNLRWSLCSQEICFKRPVLAAFFGAGKVMPIKRGHGIDQPLFLKFSRRAAAGGQWLHMFPEGKIFQSGKLGAEYFNERSAGDASSIGRLKWGVGKLVAHCPVRMVVLPFHHVGMEGIVPQYETGELKTRLPLGGNSVTVRFGEEIDFSDLIDEHERKHGKLWKYSEKEVKGER